MLRTIQRCLIAIPLIAAHVVADDAAFRYYFDLSPRGIEELDAITQTLADNVNLSPANAPIVVVLHGEEANAFVRSDYGQYKALVDRTALLDAYGVIDVKMCATWMRVNGIRERDIPPFIETVPYGAAEIERLEARGDRPAPRVKI